MLEKPKAKMKIMSLAVEPDFQDDLKLYAKKKGMSISSYVRAVMKKALKLKVEDDPMVVGVPAEEDVFPIVLFIPKNIKGNSEELQNWLDKKTSAIIKHLS